jgi:hypothetical protein
MRVDAPVLEWDTRTTGICAVFVGAVVFLKWLSVKATSSAANEVAKLFHFINFHFFPQDL